MINPKTTSKNATEENPISWETIKEPIEIGTGPRLRVSPCLYLECLGGPVRETMLNWMDCIKDPASDPKWRRKQRLKRIGKRVLSVLKIVSTVVIGSIVTWKGIKIYETYRARKK